MSGSSSSSSRRRRQQRLPLDGGRPLRPCRRGERCFDHRGEHRLEPSMVAAGHEVDRAAHQLGTDRVAREQQRRSAGRVRTPPPATRWRNTDRADSAPASRRDVRSSRRRRRAWWADVRGGAVGGTSPGSATTAADARPPKPPGSSSHDEPSNAQPHRKASESNGPTVGPFAHRHRRGGDRSAGRSAILAPSTQQRNERTR